MRGSAGESGSCARNAQEILPSGSTRFLPLVEVPSVLGASDFNRQVG